MRRDDLSRPLRRWPKWTLFALSILVGLPYLVAIHMVGGAIAGAQQWWYEFESLKRLE